MATKSLYERLVTHEDIFHSHKILGVLSLLSVWNRLRFAGMEHDMGFITWPEYTLPTVLLHWLSVVSSLMFKIPAKRIKQGTRLWPQARLHNIVFCSRHLLHVLLYWAEAQYDWQPNYWWNYAIITGAMLAADAASASVKIPSDTIRDLDAHPAAKYFFTMSQFAATSFCLLGLRRSSGHFFVVFVIQLTAFMTTLKRKNIGQHEWGVFLYGLQIAMAAGIIWTDVIQAGSMHVFSLITLVARLVHLTRIAGPTWLGPLKQKYVLWTLAAVVLHYTRPFGPNPHPIGVWLSQEPQSVAVRMTSTAMFGVTLWHGYTTVQRQLPAYRQAKKLE